MWAGGSAPTVSVGEYAAPPRKKHATSRGSLNRSTTSRGPLFVTAKKYECNTYSRGDCCCRGMLLLSRRRCIILTSIAAQSAARRRSRNEHHVDVVIFSPKENPKKMKDDVTGTGTRFNLLRQLATTQTPLQRVVAVLASSFGQPQYPTPDHDPPILRSWPSARSWPSSATTTGAMMAGPAGLLRWFLVRRCLDCTFAGLDADARIFHEYQMLPRSNEKHNTP